MPVFTDLQQWVCDPPFDDSIFQQRLPGSRAVAQTVHLVHVSGKGVGFETLVANLPQQLPTSDDLAYYTDDTRRAESLLGLPPSAYFYAGRAHPDFGNVAVAFSPECEQAHTGSATPFDTGGLVHRAKYIKLNLTPSDDEPTRVTYCTESHLALNQWRDVLAMVLAAYFDADVDYWNSRPARPDPEGLYKLNDSWRAWTFEVRFSEPQSLQDRSAWCSDEAVMTKLRRLVDDQPLTPPGDPPTAIEQFFEGPAPLVPRGTPDFCGTMERWVRSEAGL